MDFVQIGKIVNTHGLKGELKVKIGTDFPQERFKAGNTVYIEDQAFTILRARPYKDMFLIVLENYEDINLVESFKNKGIFFNVDDRHELAEDEIYLDKLIGLDAFLEDGTALGKVEEVMETAAHPILRINRTILIPYVNAFIVAEDYEENKIVIHAIEGLL